MIPVRRRRRISLNTSKCFTIGNAVIRISAISAPQTLRRSLRLNLLSTDSGEVQTMWLKPSNVNTMAMNIYIMVSLTKPTRILVRLMEVLLPAIKSPKQVIEVSDFGLIKFLKFKKLHSINMTRREVN